MANNLSYEEICEIRSEFYEKCFKDLGGKYLNGSNISKVGRFDKRPDIDGGEDFCICVNLSESLPLNFSLPTEYKGIKVFTNVVGIASTLS